MKVYAGPPTAARLYLQADRGLADDYSLTEGAGLARRFTGTAGRVEELAPLTGETYESWVAGQDRDTGAPRGRLRTDERAVRFVEVVVNGPKSWSLAAAVHPDVAAAYDAPTSARQRQDDAGQLRPPVARQRRVRTGRCAGRSWGLVGD